MKPNITATVTPIDSPAVEDSSTTWTPIVADDGKHYLDQVVPQESQPTVLSEATDILGRCIAPGTGKSTETGLVVGYIQSGKTMSIGMMCALARDNGYQLIIVIPGIATHLLDQATTRLRNDLAVEDPNRLHRWRIVQNPLDTPDNVEDLNDIFDEWRDDSSPVASRQTVLMTVLKNHRHLSNLVELLSSIQLEGIAALIIDDEADQASLDTLPRRNREELPGSATYRHLVELRRRLPVHTYLQYTATPQAPLLISITDTLSPNFIQLLTPGPNYVGGTDFFADQSDLIRIIPSHELPTADEWLDEPPESLLEAMTTFVLGVAVNLVHAQVGTPYLSMLIHPSQKTALQRQYHIWVRTIRNNWKSILASEPDGSDDRAELLDSFRHQYHDLESTVETALPEFEEVSQVLLPALRRIKILEVNARGGATPQVEWSQSSAWILVGGQAMDRGFTVEGLTVTYMPRGVGVGNADAIQQRGRFFGYKRGYLGYCRVYLSDETRHAFEVYLEHEEYMRGALQELQSEEAALDDWKRAFILDEALQPCRLTVLESDYLRLRFSDEWVYPNYVELESNTIMQNQQVLDSFLQPLAFVEDHGSALRSAWQRHDYCDHVPLAEVLQELLSRIKNSTAQESHKMTGILLQTKHILERYPNEPCRIYCMSQGRPRKRRASETGRLSELMQGKSRGRAGVADGAIYPGDREIRMANTFTIQIHRLDVRRNSVTIAENVPVLAVWIPARLSASWVFQD